MRISFTQARLKILTTVSSCIISTQIYVINSFSNLASGNDNMYAPSCQKVKPLLLIMFLFSPLLPEKYEPNLLPSVI